MTTMQAIDDIDYQARQGSVAAIIQILNEHFAPISIRTRAVIDQGVLQLLCEAPTAEQLPQEEVVSQVRSILESISPRGITRVNVNSRIVKEQQLLWLDEIKRDPEKHLLWSELITLKKMNPVSRLWRDLRAPRQRNPFLDVPTRKKVSSKAAFWRGLIGGASLCLFLVLAGWAFKDWMDLNVSLPARDITEDAPSEPEDPTPTPATSSVEDPFVQAVRLAQQAVEDGQTAQTPTEWLELAARWQRASDLMAEVPADHERYEIAQERVVTYRQNSEQALDQSEKLEAETQ